MKWILGALSIVGLIVTLALCGLSSQTVVEPDYLRIHIRANSNLTVDQNVKYKVKDAIVEALIPVLAGIESKDEAIKVMSDNFSYIESVANGVLKKEGFSYTSHAKIDNEFFPTRTYDDITLEEGNYDALILELGSGEGNNWWCILFPAFCFTKSTNSANVEYISRIWEIIKSVF
jgi:stage II sporulation protein R